MIKLGKDAHLKTFELVKAVHLIPTEFTDEILTPTLKLKRFNARNLFKATLEKLYEGLD